MLKKIYVSFLFLFLASFLSASPLHAQSAPNIAGNYRAVGTNPGNSGRYQGTASIVKEGDTYRVHWSVGTTYDGIGTLKGESFTVEWGTPTNHIGTVNYVVQSDGSMKGTWYTAKAPNSLGTEILTPVK